MDNYIIFGNSTSYTYYLKYKKSLEVSNVNREVEKFFQKVEVTKSEYFSKLKGTFRAPYLNMDEFIYYLLCYDKLKERIAEDIKKYKLKYEFIYAKYLNDYVDYIYDSNLELYLYTKDEVYYALQIMRRTLIKEEIDPTLLHLVLLVRNLWNDMLKQINRGLIDACISFTPKRDDDPDFKSLGIPLLHFNLYKIEIREKDLVLINTKNDSIIFNPNEKEIKRYEKLAEQYFFSSLNDQLLPNPCHFDDYTINFGLEVSKKQLLTLSQMKHFDDVFLSIDHEIESPTYEEFKAKYNKYIAHFPEKHLYLRLFDNKDENEMGGSFLFKNKAVLKDNLKAVKELGLDNYSLVVPSVKNKDEFLYIYKQIKEKLGNDIEVGLLVSNLYLAHNVDDYKEVSFFVLDTNRVFLELFEKDNNPENYSEPLYLRLLYHVLEAAKKINKKLYIYGKTISVRTIKYIIMGMGYENILVSDNIEMSEYIQSNKDVIFRTKEHLEDLIYSRTLEDLNYIKEKYKINQNK